MVDFVKGHGDAVTLTEEGQQVIEHIEATLTEAVAKYEESGDLNFINGLSGPYKDYHINVHKMGRQVGITPATWARDRAYGMFRIWELLEQQRESDQAQQDADAKASDLETRLATLEQKLTEALEEKGVLERQVQALESATAATEDEEDEPEAAPKRRRRKTSKAEAETPPADQAEGADDTEDEDDTEGTEDGK